MRALKQFDEYDDDGYARDRAEHNKDLTEPVRPLADGCITLQFPSVTLAAPILSWGGGFPPCRRGGTSLHIVGHFRCSWSERSLSISAGSRQSKRPTSTARSVTVAKLGSIQLLCKVIGSQGKGSAKTEVPLLAEHEP